MTEEKKKAYSIAERQRRIIEMLALGLTKVEIAQRLDVHRNTIFNDVRAMEKSILEHTANLDELSRKMLLELTFNTEFIKQQTLRILAADSTHANTRLGSLKLLKELGTDKIKMLQSLGVIYQSPQRIEGSVQVMSFHQELQDAFEEEAAKQRAEGAKRVRKQRKRALQPSD